MPSVKVLVIQFIFLLKIQDLWPDILPEDHKLLDTENLLDLKRVFVRYAMEEQLRRHINSIGKGLINNPAAMYNTLMPTSGDVLNMCYA